MNTCYVVRYATGGRDNRLFHETDAASPTKARAKVHELKVAGYAASAYRAARLFTVTDGKCYVAAGSLPGVKHVMTESIDDAEVYETLELARIAAKELNMVWCKTRDIAPQNHDLHQIYEAGPVVVRKLARIA